VRANGPAEARDIELISLEELHAIREIWISEKHEHEDRLPAMYRNVTGEPFPGEQRFDDRYPFQARDLEELEALCKSPLQYQLLRELFSVEHRHRMAAKRRGIWNDVEAAFRRSGFESQEEAVEHARAKAQVNSEIANRQQVLTRVQSPRGNDDHR